MIQQYRDRLKHSLDVFHFKSIVSMHNSLASIQGQLAGIAAQTDRIPLDWPGKDTNMGQQHEGFPDINESGAHSEIEEKSDLERVEHESPERERFEIQTIERERETFERKGDGKNREKEQIIEKARIEEDVLMQEQDQHGRNARGGSVPEYGLQVESELPQTAYGRSHHRPSTTHTNPFRQSAPPMLSPLDNPFSSGNPIYPLHGCSATLGFPTPLPGPTMPGLSCSLLDPYIQTGTSATLYRSNYLISDIAGASGNVTYVNSVVNSKSGNVTVKNISNSKNNSSIRLWLVVNFASALYSLVP
ncbi:hypothetical protein H2248_008940 [Termitomyces sp. 'cryptogamus']|nr:hypothetical protein H2248_008940 [Termitomyces sp. 'cryptogamus']